MHEFKFLSSMRIKDGQVVLAVTIFSGGHISKKRSPVDQYQVGLSEDVFVVIMIQELNLIKNTRMEKYCVLVMCIYFHYYGKTG